MTLSDWYDQIIQPEELERVECTGTVQFYTTFRCLNDIFVVSKGCKQPKQRRVCRSVCEQLGRSIGQFIEECPSTTSDWVKNRREQLKSLGRICRQIPLIIDSFGDSKKCINGVKLDYSSCGFSGDTPLALQYCDSEQSIYGDCCSRIKEQESNDVADYELEEMDVFQPFQVLFDADPEDQGYIQDSDDEQYTSNTKKSDPTTVNPFGISTTAIIAITICVCVILIFGVVISYAVRTRRRQRASRKGSQKLRIPRRYNSYQSELISNSQKYIVKYDYQPNLPDEMELKVGDVIQFYQVCDDRWGDAYNLTSFEEGKACTLYMSPLKE